MTTSSSRSGRRTNGSASAFLRAARGESVPHIPVWFMRQAGRSLPEYLVLREGIGTLEPGWTPSWSSRSTMQPVRRYGVDVAIFFSDSCRRSRRSASTWTSSPAWSRGGIAGADAGRRRGDPGPDGGSCPFITEAVRGLVGQLGATPLIGFAGAPFTVASYLVEGGPSRRRPDEGDDVRAPDVGTPDAEDRRHRRGVPRGPGRGGASASSCSTRGPAR